MRIKEVLNALEKFAPLPLQDGFDNAGLQIGLTEVEVTGALLCLDVTETVIDEAIDLGYNLIIAHHPLLFKGYKSITGKDYVERCILKAIKNDIVIYAAHTNLDNAPLGVNYKIASILGLKDLSVLSAKEESLSKLVTFVPVEHAEKVRSALFEAGCGNIGKYSECSYNLEGEGSFKASAKAHPFVGEKDELHFEKEVRIETVVPNYKINNAIQSLLQAHPYEEVAYDIYPLKNQWSQVGSGVIGELPQPISALEFLQQIKEKFHVGCVLHNCHQDRLIQKVALCGGAGSFLIPQAQRKGADLFLTGEIKYHDYFGYENQMILAAIGHYESEQYTSDLLLDYLNHNFPQLNKKISTINTNPIKYL